MERDACIKISFAAHRVADAFLAGEREGSYLKESANNILADMMLVLEQNPVTRPQKLQVIPRTVREIDILLRILEDSGSIEDRTRRILQSEYGKMQAELKAMLAGEQKAREERAAMEVRAEESVTRRAPDRSAVQEEPKQEERSRKDAPEGLESPKQVRARARKLSERQERILAMLRQKDRVQIWELQKILPNVTKRTLRRDMDDLLAGGMVEREGEWNSVSYRIRQGY